MKKMLKDIEKLEETFRDEFVWNSTFIDPSCWTNTELKLFKQTPDMDQLKNLEQFPSFASLNYKKIFYAIRRVIDLFMTVMNVHLENCEGRYIFWMRFLNFLSETMFIINRNRGTQMLLEQNFGENSDNWPEDDDPAWKKFEEQNRKWESDFTEYWEETSLSAKKIFSKTKTSLCEKQETEVKNEPLSMNQVYGELITHSLVRSTATDIYVLVTISTSEKTKTLMEILLEQESQQV